MPSHAVMPSQAAVAPAESSPSWLSAELDKARSAQARALYEAMAKEPTIAEPDVEQLARAEATLAAARAQVSHLAVQDAVRAGGVALEATRNQIVRAHEAAMRAARPQIGRAPRAAMLAARAVV